MTFTDRTVLVTGGAQGIGLASARLYLQQGAKVAIWALHAESAALAQNILGSEVLAAVVDVGVSSAVAQGYREIEQRFGPIDVLVNNAGYTDTTPFLQETPEYWHRVIDTNLWGVIYTTRAVLPAMVERKSGTVVNVVSDAGRVGMAGEAVYAAAKGGIIALSKSLAQEMARHHIRINCVSPGPTRTRILQENSHSADDLIAKMIRRIPLKEIAEPEDIAQSILFLAGDQSRHITGQVLSVSGGLTMI